MGPDGSCDKEQYPISVGSQLMRNTNIGNLYIKAICCLSILGRDRKRFDQVSSDQIRQVSFLSYRSSP